MPGLPVHHQLPELTQTHAHWVGDAIQPSHPLSSPSPPAFNLSQHQGLFQSWLFTSSGQSIGISALSISPSNEYSELISFRMDWLDLLAVQGTLKSLLHHHSSKASILRCSAGSLFTIYFKYLRHRYTKKEKKKSIYLKLQWTESCILFAKADKTLLVPLPGAEFRFWIPHSPLTGVVLKQTFLDLLIHEIEPLRHWPWSPLNLLQLFFKPAEPQMQRGHQHILD